MPDRLFDGSRAARSPVVLEGVKEPAFLTRGRMVSSVQAVPRSAAVCRRETLSPLPGDLVVERTGVSGESVTFADPQHRHLVACDNSGGERERGRRWCGGSVGQIVRGRLLDPRLDVLCRTRDGRRLGFFWVQPSITARYVVVEQGSYSEVYEPIGDLPVRIATSSGVSEDPLRISVGVSEHDQQGMLLRRYRLNAVPAG